MCIRDRSIIQELRCIPTNEVRVDFYSLASLATSIKEPNERLKKVDLAAIRKAYEDGDLNSENWCNGQKLLVDALSKDSRVTAELLLAALSTAMHEWSREMTANHGRPSKPADQFCIQNTLS